MKLSDIDYNMFEGMTKERIREGFNKMPAEMKLQLTLDTMKAINFLKRKGLDYHNIGFDGDTNFFYTTIVVKETGEVVAEGWHIGVVVFAYLKSVGISFEKILEKDKTL